MVFRGDNCGLAATSDLQHLAPSPLPRFPQTIDPKQEALVRSLLSICTLRAQSISGANLVPELAQAGEGDATIPLIRICARSTGVTQSLALQALKTWCEDHDGCIDKCIHANAVPLLLRILAASLPAAAPGTSAAYSSSMAVILLKALVRQGQDGAAAFLDASGVETLLNLITQPSLDNRSLCLALYLINDTTRRSMEVLNHTINAGAVPHIVDILR